ncbi:hypothetical protein FF100_22095 [Methylobacterium terricola]|uniref:Uncharacterized protein n=1 Tax=Methylobacterium terricola TaxID=2583531 RepID=A0A5C4LF65_9HYPH|nr:hypothetical protein [Methylobacterium terricola]TNC10845.1 hypothetical protein FF100_22095 [Methylobacterium terricola]
MTYETPHDHAASAKALIEHKAFQKAVLDLSEHYRALWDQTPAADLSALQDIKYRQEALKAFLAQLEAALVTGKIADFNTKTSRKIK